MCVCFPRSWAGETDSGKTHSGGGVTPYIHRGIEPQNLSNHTLTTPLGLYSPPEYHSTCTHTLVQGGYRLCNQWPNSHFLSR
jgi:hypothetical protein